MRHEHNSQKDRHDCGGKRGRHRHFGEGPRRPIDHGSLRLVALSILAEAPRHGYELMREIEDRSGGNYCPSPGAIYPLLNWSEETGLAEIVSTDGKRKRYALTQAGADYLGLNEAPLAAALERLGSLPTFDGNGRRGRHGGRMDRRVAKVLADYHLRMDKERADREAGRQVDRESRLLAVGPETGALINLMARSLEAPTILEIGTSYGYSGIWLADAARAAGGRLITMEISPEKSAYARDMSERAGLAGHVDFRVGDAVAMIGAMSERVDFVLMDIWNGLYEPCLNALAPKLNPGAIIVADNIRPGDQGTAGYLAALRAIPGMASVPIPVGSGLEISRYLPKF